MMNSTNNSEYLSRYMDDLLLKHTYDCDSIDVEDSIGEDAYIPMEKYRLSIHYPDTFRCRGRIGRNGRLVTDRIPVYKSDRDHNGMPTGVKTNTDHSINVVYGAVLKNKQSVPGDAGNQLQVPTLPLANFGINYNYMDADNDEYQCHGHNYMNHVHGNVNNQSLHSHDGYDLYRLNMQDLMNYPHTGENIHMKLKLSENGSGNSNTNSIYNISL